MIASLTGRLISKAPSHLILDVHGVGYEVWIPLSTYFSLPDLNDVLSLQIFTQFRDNAIQLFGFLTTFEKEAFILLTGISGIGGKLALSVLSTLSVTDLVTAIQEENLETLSTVPGVGRKSAGRMILELKEKTAMLQAASSSTPLPPVSSSPMDHLAQDAVSALVNLGYREQDVKKVVQEKVQASSEPLSLSDLIRDALKGLAKH